VTCRVRAWPMIFPSEGSFLPALPPAPVGMTLVWSVARSRTRRRVGGLGRMLRAAVWTIGLFGVGTSVVRMFPRAGWVEPIVLLALGVAFLYVSKRIGVRDRRARTALAPKQAAA